MKIPTWSELLRTLILFTIALAFVVFGTLISNSLKCNLPTKATIKL
jgi:hypothetical protein